MMPQFIVDLPGGGGKRLASSFESYDRSTGVSRYEREERGVCGIGCAMAIEREKKKEKGCGALHVHSFNGFSRYIAPAVSGSTEKLYEYQDPLWSIQTSN